MGQGQGRKPLLYFSVKYNQGPRPEAEVRQREMSGWVFPTRILRPAVPDTAGCLGLRQRATPITPLPGNISACAQDNAIFRSPGPWVFPLWILLLYLQAP